MGNEHEQATHDALDKRISKTENELSTLVSVTARQGEQLASVVTSIESMSSQVGALFKQSSERASRPTPWGVIISGIGVLIIIGTLSLAPIMANITELKAFDGYMMRHLEKDAYEMGIHETNTKWLMKAEDRLNDQIHNTLKD